MKNKKGVIVKRQQTILQRLQKEKEVSVDQLANELGVSPLTIRRDLIEFENQGFVKRHYGGAKLIEGTLFEDPTLDVPPATGQDGTTDYRRVVAKKAAELIEEGDIIFVNSSKTALLMLDYISGKRVSVITNNGNSITSSHDPLVSIILTGGELHGTKCSLVGDFALATIRKIRANKCFIGVSGITAEGEISTAVLQETMVNSLMIERAKDMVVILADYKRIGKLHNFIIADTHQITHIVTDELADEAVTSRLEKDNVTILKGHVTD